MGNAKKFKDIPADEAQESYEAEDSNLHLVEDEDIREIEDKESDSGLNITTNFGSGVEKHDEQSPDKKRNKINKFVDRLKKIDGVSNIRVETVSKERQRSIRLTFFHQGKKYHKEVYYQPEKVVKSKRTFTRDPKNGLVEVNEQKRILKTPNTSDEYAYDESNESYPQDSQSVYSVDYEQPHETGDQPKFGNQTPKSKADLNYKDLENKRLNLKGRTLPESEFAPKHLRVVPNESNQIPHDEKPEVIYDEDIKEREDLLSIDVDLRDTCQTADYFYQFENHTELYKLGSLFKRDFENGVRNFAFFGHEDERPTHRTILGLASYFAQKYDKINTLIIGDNFDRHELKDLISSKSLKNISLKDGKFPQIDKLKTSPEFLSYSELAKFYDIKSSPTFFYKFLEESLDDYDIIFWEVPSLEEYQNNRSFYHPMIKIFELVSLIVNYKEFTYTDLNQVLSFFKNYEIEIKGIIESQ